MKTYKRIAIAITIMLIWFAFLLVNKAEGSYCEELNFEYSQLGHVLDASQQDQDYQSLERIDADLIISIKKIIIYYIECRKENFYK